MSGWRVRRILAAAVAAAIAAVLFARTREPDYSKVAVSAVADLERELESLRERLGIPGMSAAIAERDRVVWARGFGWANVERPVAVDPAVTSFHLASVTKPYAATVVLQLADEGRLDLDAPVSEFGIDMPRDKPVRVWHLLSHTSGGTPGTTFRYDARAFGALTTVVERATGRPFAAELTDRIVRRLRLEHTAPNPREINRDACRSQLSSRLLNLCGTAEQAEHARGTFAASGLDRRAADRDLAVGYARRWGRHLWPAGLFGPMRPAPPLTDLFASGGLVASAVDVARFSIALDQGVLLQKPTLARTFQPAIETAGATPKFGLPWFLQEYRGSLLAWQFGQAVESSSLLLKIPESQVTFVVLANSDGLSRRRRLGDHGDVLGSPAAMLFLNWYSSGKRLR